MSNEDPPVSFEEFQRILRENEQLKLKIQEKEEATLQHSSQETEEASVDESRIEMIKDEWNSSRDNFMDEEEELVDYHEDLDDSVEQDYAEHSFKSQESEDNAQENQNKPLTLELPQSEGDESKIRPTTQAISPIEWDRDEDDDEFDNSHDVDMDEAVTMTTVRCENGDDELLPDNTALPGRSKKPDNKSTARTLQSRIVTVVNPTGSSSLPFAGGTQIFDTKAMLKSTTSAAELDSNATDTTLPPRLPSQIRHLFSKPGARYFMIKSHNYENVTIAKNLSVWSTTRANEKRLNSAYVSSDSVFLIFSVRESGHFQGYARIAGVDPKERVDWVLPPGMDPSHLSGVFLLDWLSRSDLSFTKTSHLINSWNDHKQVKIGRDGQEIEPSCGESLCRLFPLDSNVDIDELIVKSKTAKRLPAGAPTMTHSENNRSPPRNVNKDRSSRTTYTAHRSESSSNPNNNSNNHHHHHNNNSGSSSSNLTAANLYNRAIHSRIGRPPMPNDLPAAMQAMMASIASQNPLLSTAAAPVLYNLFPAVNSAVSSYTAYSRDSRDLHRSRREDALDSRHVSSSSRHGQYVTRKKEHSPSYGSRGKDPLSAGTYEEYLRRQSSRRTEPSSTGASYEARVSEFLRSISSSRTTASSKPAKSMLRANSRGSDHSSPGRGIIPKRRHSRTGGRLEERESDKEVVGRRRHQAYADRSSKSSSGSSVRSRSPVQRNFRLPQRGGRRVSPEFVRSASSSSASSAAGHRGHHVRSQRLKRRSSPRENVSSHRRGRLTERYH